MILAWGFWACLRPLITRLFYQPASPPLLLAVPMAITRRTTAAQASPANGAATAAAVVKENTRIDKGRKRSGLELPRKILHSSMSFLALYVSAAPCSVGMLPRGPRKTKRKRATQTWLAHPHLPTLLFWLSVALGVIVTADLVRFSSAKFARVYNAVLGLFMREEEASQINGVVFYLAGVILVVIFLPRGELF